MIHGRADGNSGRHFVVEQSTDSCAKGLFDKSVVFVIAARGVGIDRARQIAFQHFGDLDHLINGIGLNKQRAVAKSLRLKDFRIDQELPPRHFQQRILEADSFAAAWLSAGDQRRSGIDQCPNPG